MSHLTILKSLIIVYFEVFSQKWFEPRQKKKHDPHPRFELGSVPTLVINTAGASLLDPSVLDRQDKSPSFCGLFHSEENKSLVPGGQNFYGRTDDEASSTLLKRLDLCPSGPESTSTTELKNEASFESRISLPK